MTRTEITRGAALLLVAAVAWGGMFPVAKATLPSVDAFWLTSIRYAIASLVFVALLARSEGRAALRFEGRVVRLALLGATGFAGFGLFAFAGLARSRPEHGAIVMATQPLIAALVLWAARGVRPRPVTWGSIAAALVGVILVISRGHLNGLLAADTAVGDLLILAGGVSWVAYTLGASAFPGWSPLRYTALTCILGVPSILAATAVATLTGASRMPGAPDLVGVAWQLAYVTAIASVLAVLAWNMGNRLLGSGNALLFINFVPVTAFAIGLARGQEFAAVELAGAALVIAALVANTLLLRPARSPRPAGRASLAAAGCATRS